jgi:hypothetical protein
MARIRIDESTWPILVVTLPEQASDDEVGAYLTELGGFRARRTDFALIVDASDSRGFSAKQRQMQAEYIEAGIDISRRHLKAFAFVARSAPQRGVLTAIFWLGRPAWPHRVFASVSDARVWCEEKLVISKAT